MIRVGGGESSFIRGWRGSERSGGVVSRLGKKGRGCELDTLGELRWGKE